MAGHCTTGNIGSRDADEPLSLNANVDTSLRVNGSKLPSAMAVTRSGSAELRSQQKEEGGIERSRVQPTDKVVNSREVDIENSVPDSHVTPKRFGRSTFTSPLSFEGALTDDYSVIEKIPWFSRTSVQADDENNFENLELYP